MTIPSARPVPVPAAPPDPAASGTDHFGVLGPARVLPTEALVADLFASAAHRPPGAPRPCPPTRALVRRKGRGTFVRGIRVRGEIDLPHELHRQPRGRGVPVRDADARRERFPADSDVAGSLGVRPVFGRPSSPAALACISAEPAAILGCVPVPAAPVRSSCRPRLRCRASRCTRLETAFRRRLGFARSRSRSARLNEVDGPLLHEPEGAAMIRSLRGRGISRHTVPRSPGSRIGPTRFAFTMTSRSTSSRSQVDGRTAHDGAERRIRDDTRRTADHPRRSAVHASC